MKLGYHELYLIAREEAEAVFSSGAPEEIASALVNVAFRDPDWRWVQDKCLGFARSDVDARRCFTITNIGMGQAILTG